MTDDLRCVAHTTALAEDPAASAGSAETYVLVETPLPWPKPIDAHELLAPVAEQRPILSPTARVFAVGAERPTTGGHRLVTYRRDPGHAFGGFVGRESVVATGELTDAVIAAIDGELVGTPTAGRDLLICTQGSHDRCCGQLGTRLHQQMLDERIDGIRVWRTSHTGGHRFAPTALSFPDGHAWAHLDARLLGDILATRADPTEAARHLRGCLGLPERAAQMVDRDAFARYGWPWIEATREWVVDGERVSIRATVGGRDIAVSAVVTPGRTVPVPVCGEPIEAATKTTVELVVDDLDNELSRR
ncbi:MAG: hypothetical protein OEU32_15070 [Acidimicrobiia bacterium]|nr:hypothetical protein [Acidimicrobiia bacterium]